MIDKEASQPPIIFPLGITLSSARGRLAVKLPYTGYEATRKHMLAFRHIREELTAHGWSFCNQMKIWNNYDNERNRSIALRVIEEAVGMGDLKANAGPPQTEEIPVGVIRKSNHDFIEYIFSKGEDFRRFDPISRHMGGSKASQAECFNRLTKTRYANLEHEGNGKYRVKISKSFYFTFTSADRREVYPR